jgi:hypothetical protein
MYKGTEQLVSQHFKHTLQGCFTNVSLQRSGWKCTTGQHRSMFGLSPHTMSAGRCPEIVNAVP